MGKMLLKKANELLVNLLESLADLGKGASYALKH